MLSKDAKNDSTVSYTTTLPTDPFGQGVDNDGERRDGALEIDPRVDEESLAI